jgi:NDP-sugar pyrophosphorylase family protein
MTIETPVLVLMGGRATRLRRIAGDRPKALVPFFGVPFLELLLRKLRREGFGDVVLVSDRPRHDVERVVARAEPAFERLAMAFDTGGTARAVLAGLRAVDGPQALCLNGDTILDLDYAGVLERQHASGSTVTTVTTTRFDAPNRGAVRIGPHDGVVAFAEGDAGGPVRPHGRYRCESNCGSYALDVGELERELRRSGDRSFERETLPRLSLLGRVGALSAGERFFADFGTPARLTRVRRQGRVLRRIYGV